MLPMTTLNPNKMKHPLTDEICDQIQDSIYPCDPANMRAAADWQLEQVIEFIAKEDTVYADYIKQAMRPQEDNS